MAKIILTIEGVKFKIEVDSCVDLLEELNVLLEEHEGYCVVEHIKVNNKDFMSEWVEINLLIEFVDYFVLREIGVKDFVRFLNYVNKVYGEFVYEDRIVIYSSVDDYLDNYLPRNPLDVKCNYPAKIDKRDFLKYYNLTRLKAAIKRAENTFITSDGVLIVID